MLACLQPYHTSQLQTALASPSCHNPPYVLLLLLFLLCVGKENDPHPHIIPSISNVHEDIKG